jgi:hypothetical protein
MAIPHRDWKSRISILGAGSFGFQFLPPPPNLHLNSDTIEGIHLAEAPFDLGTQLYGSLM